MDNSDGLHLRRIVQADTCTLYMVHIIPASRGTHDDFVPEHTVFVVQVWSRWRETLCKVPCQVRSLFFEFHPEIWRRPHWACRDRATCWDHPASACRGHKFGGEPTEAENVESYMESLSWWLRSTVDASRTMLSTG
jgi:hypothetical protein